MVNTNRCENKYFPFYIAMFSPAFRVSNLIVDIYWR